MPGLRLKSLRYTEMLGQPKEWTLDRLSLGQTNLIVGTNATGKTRVMNVVRSLARLFVPEPKFRVNNCGYDLVFDHDGREYGYILGMEGGKVVKEEVRNGVAEDPVLLRHPNGEVEIYTEQEKKKLRFQPPENEPAALARRDSLQHKFLEPLHAWAMAVRHYSFGASMGKDSAFLPIKNGPEADERDSSQVVPIFQKGRELYKESFVNAIFQDMARLQYDLEKIDVVEPETLKVLRDGIPTSVVVMGVRERGIDGMIEQNEISQGMFRALSILIQVNYSQMSGGANCILIDDIGEGLDFERSTELINILLEKAKESSFQLVMATNDRFVMNSVPLEAWSVLQRTGGHVQVRNYENSKKHFDQFKLTGLNNFDFLRYNFLNEDPDEVFEEVGADKAE